MSQRLLEPDQRGAALQRRRGPDPGPGTGPLWRW